MHEGYFHVTALPVSTCVHEIFAFFSHKPLLVTKLKTPPFPLESPGYYLSLFYSKNFAPKGPNYTHFADKEFDVLYESALGETNQNKIEIIYKKMDSLIISKSIIVPLFYDEVIRFTRKNLNGMQINDTNLLDLRYVKKLSNSL